MKIILYKLQQKVMEKQTQLLQMMKRKEEHIIVE